MLVDYIKSESLPWIVVWLDWCFYSYRPALVVILALFMDNYWQRITHHSWEGIGLSMFIGFCAWVVWCWAQQGYAVG